MRTHELYSRQDLRDQRARELKARKYVVKKSSIRNQLLHPMYVEDLKGGLSAADCGFGNTIYKTHFSVLYAVDWEEPKLDLEKFMNEPCKVCGAPRHRCSC